MTYQPVHQDERVACERRAGRPLPTDEHVMRFLREEREFAMREQLLRGDRGVDLVAEVRSVK